MKYLQNKTQLDADNNTIKLCILLFRWPFYASDDVHLYYKYNILGWLRKK